MKLYLSRNVSFDTVLSDDEGRARFTISSQGKFVRGVTTISHVTSEAVDEEGEIESTRGLLDRPKLRDDGGFAALRWKFVDSTTMEYNCQVFDLSAFLPYANFLRNKRSFNGPDGVVYTWCVGPTSSLYVQDENGAKRCVVKMHQRNILTGTKSYLEIDSSVVHILDLIVVTWVYMETTRRDFYGLY